MKGIRRNGLNTVVVIGLLTFMIFGCNDVGVTIQNAAPSISSVSIIGSGEVGTILIGRYSYFDPENDPESGTTFRWLRYDDSGCTVGETVVGTSSSYTLTSNEEDKYLKFEVIPGASSGTSPGEAALSLTITVYSSNAAPVASSVSISGTKELGSTLTGSYTYSDAENDPESGTTFRWLRYDDSGCTAGETVVGTSSSYTLTSNEEDKYLKFEVTPGASSGTSPGEAALSSAIAVNSTNAAPTASLLSISGTEEVGSTLTGSYTYRDAENDPESGTTFRWLRYDDSGCTVGETVVGTASSFTLTGNELGKYLKFEVTPGASSGTSPGLTASSSATGAITANAAPAASSLSITGTEEVGYTLTGSYTYSDAENDPESGTTFRWLRYDDSGCTIGETVVGTTSSYTLTNSEGGKFLRFEVTPGASSGTSPGSAALSAVTGAITTNTAPSASSVSISGTEELGSTLTGSYTYSDAENDPESGTTFRWLRYDDSGCTVGETVVGTASSYTLTSSELGKYLKFEVKPGSSSGISPGTAVLSAASNSIVTALPSGYIMRWKTDNNGSDEQLNYHLYTTAGDPVYHSSELKDGTHSLLVDGNDAIYDTLLFNGATLPGNALSVALWMNASSLSSGYPRSFDWSQIGIGFEVSTSKIVGVMNNASSFYVASADTINLNQWYHVVITWNGLTETFSLYVDGQSSASSNFSGQDVANFNDIIVIGNDDSGSNGIQGYVDDVLFYDKALSAEEVEQLFDHYR